VTKSTGCSSSPPCFEHDTATVDYTEQGVYVDDETTEQGWYQSLHC